jgi:hypothetical protein
MFRCGSAPTMNNATAFALTTCTAAMFATIGFCVGVASRPSPAQTPPTVQVREVVREVPVIREVITERQIPPDDAAIRAAVDARLASMRGTEEQQFWRELSRRIDRIKRRATVASMNATSSAVTQYNAIQRALSYEDSIDPQRAFDELSRVLRQPNINGGAESLAKDALDDVLEAMQQASRLGYGSVGKLHR